MKMREDPLYEMAQSLIFSMAVAVVVVAASVWTLGFFNPLNSSALYVIVMVVAIFAGLWYLPQRRPQRPSGERVDEPG